MLRLIAAVALLAGCATGIVAVTPHTSPEIEAARKMCLEQPGGVWMETTERARCAVPVLVPEPEHKT